MSDTKERKPSPIEVWLSKRNIEIKCMVVHEDETIDELDVESLSMRGAQREMTGWFLSQGYKPMGRWEVEETAKAGDYEGEAIETVRRFKLASEPVFDQVRSILDSSNTPQPLAGSSS